jgi:D-3-phosphoglycerate dehydrogenase
MRRLGVRVLMGLVGVALLACYAAAAYVVVEVGLLLWRARPSLATVAVAVVVLAFGPIARRFCDLLAGFDLTLVVHDPFVDEGTVAAHGAELLDYDAVLARSDHLSVHAPATPATRGMVDADALATLPDHAVVVNTGRGAVIDEAALADALDAGEVAAAGLDVLREEPPGEGNPLVGRDDVVLTPHAAWYSVEARRDLTETVGRDVRAVLVDGRDADLAGRVDPDAEWV